MGLLSFNDYLLENRSELSGSVDDLRRLRELGLIDQEAYLKGLLELAAQHSVDPTTLLEPGDVIFAIEEDGEEDEISPAMRESMGAFRGPNGEVPLLVKGRCDVPYYDFEVTLSDQSVFRIYYRSFYDEHTVSLESAGRTHTLDEESRDQVEETMAQTADWVQYLNDVLWLLLQQK